MLSSATVALVVLYWKRVFFETFRARLAIGFSTVMLLVLWGWRGLTSHLEIGPILGGFLVTVGIQLALWLIRERREFAGAAVSLEIPSEPTSRFGTPTRPV